MDLVPYSQLDWHDPTCRRLDYALVDNQWAICLSCGSSVLEPYEHLESSVSNTTTIKLDPSPQCDSHDSRLDYPLVDNHCATCLSCGSSGLKSHEHLESSVPNTTTIKLVPSSQLDWHDPTCHRLDYALVDNHWATCLSCGSSGLKPYKHPPLLSDTSVRLLWLIPGNFEDPIRCNLDVENLQHGPIFSAISYTWADENGDDRKLREIILDGRPFKVTKNCELALRRVRQDDLGISIWIDAICIDQDNDLERGHQVKLMPQIYHQATRVMMYIGECEEIQLMLEQFISLSKTGICFKRAALIDFGSDIWNGIRARRYFTRLWILQEIALARQPILLCGNSSVSWKEITEWFPSRINALPTWQDSVLMFNRTLSTEPNMELLILDGARKAHAKDPRDKVYGILGLLPGQRLGSLVADYTISAQTLYVKVAIHLAELHGWSAVLQRAGPRYQSLSLLPSWVPDWSCAPDALLTQPKSTQKELSDHQIPRIVGNAIRLDLIPSLINAERWFVIDSKADAYETYLLIEDKESFLGTFGEFIEPEMLDILADRSTIQEFPDIRMSFILRRTLPGGQSPDRSQEPTQVPPRAVDEFESDVEEIPRRSYRSRWYPQARVFEKSESDVEIIRRRSYRRRWYQQTEAFGKYQSDVNEIRRRSHGRLWYQQAEAFDEFQSDVKEIRRRSYRRRWHQQARVQVRARARVQARVFHKLESDQKEFLIPADPKYLKVMDLADIKKFVQHRSNPLQIKGRVNYENMEQAQMMTCLEVACKKTWEERLDNDGASDIYWRDDAESLLADAYLENPHRWGEELNVMNVLFWSWFVGRYAVRLHLVNLV